MEMWSLFNLKTISEHLNRALDQSLIWTLWQSSSQGRVKWQGKITSVDEKLTTMTITSGDMAEIWDQEPIFAHCPELDIIFKRDKFSKLPDALNFKTPSEIKLVEQRKVPRFKYKYQDYKVVSFKVAKKDEKMSFTLVDLSTEGLAFVLPQKDSLSFSEGLELVITHITDQELPKEHAGKVVNVNRFQLPEGLTDRTNAQELMRVGVQFTESLDSVSYKSIASIIEKKQLANKGIETDGFNGLNEDELERTLAKIRQDNPVLAANLLDRIEELDRLKYMTNQMKQIFWTETKKELVATALRLSSKELIRILLSDLTENMKNEFLDLINQPKPPSAINKAQDELVKFIRGKEKAGEFVLDPKSYVKYV
ncbi:MAG: hypothetical protein OHK0056_19760 [Bacteriovoracaceae bacterium]